MSINELFMKKYLSFSEYFSIFVVVMITFGFWGLRVFRFGFLVMYNGYGIIFKYVNGIYIYLCL